MKESTFRVILGLWLLVGLYSGLHALTLVMIGLILFEGITNYRVPLLVSRLCGKDVTPDRKIHKRNWIPFEAERFMRLLLVIFLLISYLVFPQHLWWLPWFIAFALIGAGLSGMCPMVITLRYVGFR